MGFFQRNYKCHALKNFIVSYFFVYMTEGLESRLDLEFLELFWARNHKTNLGIWGQSYEEKRDRFIAGETH